MRAVKLAILTVCVSLSIIGPVFAVVEDADSTNEVPEPGTMALLVTGLGVGAAAFFRKRK